MDNLPAQISLTFFFTALLTLFLLYKAFIKSEGFASQANKILFILVIWALFQSLLANSGFYLKNLDSMPPRFSLALLPPFFLILVLFFSKKGKAYMDSLPLKELTMVSVVRIPVELVLYGLFFYKTVPELMTFTGRNFDILAGLTAPIVAYLYFSKKSIGKNALLVWNIIGIGLLTFIVINALLSAPLPFQKFAFNQPNVAVAYFPFILLPSLIVPIVFFSHFVSVRKLLLEN